MSIFKEYLEPFRATRSENVYKLYFRFTNKQQQQIEIKENVDAYYGEVGKTYVKNLLFWIGNEMVKETELESVEWKKMNLENLNKNRDFAYKKQDDEGNCLLVLAKWYES